MMINFFLPEQSLRTNLVGFSFVTEKPNNSLVLYKCANMQRKLQLLFKMLVISGLTYNLGAKFLYYSKFLYSIFDTLYSLKKINFSSKCVVHKNVIKKS